MKALLIGHIGKGNFGDDFMTIALLRYLSNKYNNLELICLSSESIINLNKVKYKKESLNNIIKYIFLSDTVIVNGGNYLHDYSSNIRFKFSPFIKFGIVSIFTAIFKKKLIFTGQGFGPFSSNLAKMAFRLIFRNVDYISVRDKESLRLFKKIMPKNYHYKCKLTMDSTYFFYKNPGIFKSNKENTKPVIGVNLLPFYEKYFNDKKRDLAIIKELFDLIMTLIKTNKFSNNIIFCVFNRKKSESEKSLFKKLESMIREHEIVNVEYLVYEDVESFIDRFSKIDFFIGMRLHGIILSQILGIQQINIAYHPKCINIAETIGISHRRIIPINSFNAKNVNINFLIMDRADKFNLEKDLLRKVKLFEDNALPKKLF